MEKKVSSFGICMFEKLTLPCMTFKGLWYTAIISVQPVVAVNAPRPRHGAASRV